jgi:hypothetical protein
MQTPARFWGAIFDVDGVLVDSPHEQAWREGLQQLMDNEWTDIRDQTSYAPEKFTPEVYQKQMSGKPRYAGAQAVLEYVGVPGDVRGCPRWPLRCDASSPAAPPRSLGAPTAPSWPA